MDNVKFVSKEKSLSDFPVHNCFFETWSEANSLLFKLDKSLNNSLRIINTEYILKALSVNELNRLILPLI